MAGAYTSADLVFVDSYTAATQTYYKINFLVATDAAFLTTAYASTKIAFGLQKGSTSVIYNIYIISTTANSIVKYSSTALTAAASGGPVTGATTNTFTLKFTMLLGVDSIT